MKNLPTKIALPPRPTVVIDVRDGIAEVTAYNFDPDNVTTADWDLVESGTDEVLAFETFDVIADTMGEYWFRILDTGQEIPIPNIEFEFCDKKVNPGWDALYVRCLWLWITANLAEVTTWISEQTKDVQP